MSEHIPSKGDLSPEQRLILDGFSAQYNRETIVQDGQSAALYDQAVAEMREKVTDGFYVELESDKEFYDVMTGVAVATKQMERLVVAGMTPTQASHIIRVSIAGLRPE
jgi:hypothetical protein